VDRPLGAVDDEVVDQAAVPSQRLGPNASRPSFDVGGAKIGHQPRGLGGEGAAACSAAQLADPDGLPVDLYAVL